MTRRSRLVAGAAAALAAMALTAGPAAAGGNGEQASRKAAFEPLLYADGEVYGTNLNGNLPAPTAQNRHSYDDLYVFTNGAEGQMPVAEAAPGPGYNGGRWAVMELTWADGAEPMVLTSSAQVRTYLEMGYLTAEEAGVYFSCPLVPVK